MLISSVAINDNHDSLRSHDKFDSETANLVREEFLNETGQDLEKMSQAHGFEVTYQVPNTNGVYIVHVGQTHYRPGTELDKAQRTRVIDCQKRIASLIRSMSASKTDKFTVYEEGVSVETQKYLDLYITSYLDDLAAIKPGRDALSMVMGQYEIESNADRREMLQSDDGTPYLSNNFVLDILLDASIKRCEEIIDYYKKNPDTYVPSSDFTDYEIPSKKTTLKEEIARFRTFVSRNKDKVCADQMYLQGAVAVLAGEGRVTVGASERSEVNDAASKVVERLLEIDGEYQREYLTVSLNASLGRVDDAEIAKVKEKRKELDRLNALYSQMAIKDREDVAIKEIADNLGTSSNKFVLLVYGNNHDYTRAVQKHNDQSAQRIGLIKLGNKVLEQSEDETQ